MPSDTPTFITQKATKPPGKCVVTGDIDGPFLDCGIQYENRGYWQRLYLHAPWVEEMATRHLGMVSRAEVSKLAARVKAAEAELESIQIKAEAIRSVERAEAALAEAIT